MSKQEDYKLLLSQVKAMVKDETDAVANMANVAALIQETFQIPSVRPSHGNKNLYVLLQY